MCQLLYINLKDKRYNQLATYYGILRDSSFQHKDGWGIYTEKRGTPLRCYAKLEETSNLHLFPNLFDDNPVIAHVRKASVATKINDSSFNHPFESSHYILAHNGTLDNGEEIPKDKIDTQIFLDKLVEEYNEKSEFPDIFNKTMEKFWGKFAFIIKDKKSNNNFVIRGASADLYKSEFLVDNEFHGYIINTERTSLVDILMFLRVLFLTIDHTKEYSFSPPELLDAESIFLAKDDNLEKIAETKELKEVDLFPEKVKKAENTTLTRWQGRGYPDYSRNWHETDWENGYYYSRGTSTYSYKGNFSNKVSKLLSYLSVEELDEIFMYVYGICLLGMNDGLFEHFEDNYIDKFLELCTDEKCKLWNSSKMLPGNKLSIWELYTKSNIQFPYFVNDYTDLAKALKKAHWEQTEEKSIEISKGKTIPPC